MPIALDFSVSGVAQPKGSARAFVPKGWTRPVITTANQSLKAWEQVVRAELQRVMAESDRGVLMRLFDAPIVLTCTFYLPRPKTKAKARHHTVRPDLDKLVRGLIDALRSVAFRDDVQVTDIVTKKRYAAVDAKVDVRIEAAEDIALEPRVGALRLEA